MRSDQSYHQLRLDLSTIYGNDCNFLFCVNHSSFNSKKTAVTSDLKFIIVIFILMYVIQLNSQVYMQGFNLEILTGCFSSESWLVSR